MTEETGTTFGDLTSAIPPHIVDPSAPNPSVEDVLEWGYCHALAVELHDRTGWPVVGLRGPDRPYDGGSRIPPGYRGEIEHFAVQRPDGLVVDVRGARPLAEVGNYTITTNVDLDYLRNPADMENPADVADLVRQVADRLLDGAQETTSTPPAAVPELVSASYPTSLRDSLLQSSRSTDSAMPAPSAAQQPVQER